MMGLLGVAPTRSLNLLVCVRTRSVAGCLGGAIAAISSHEKWGWGQN